MVLVYIPIKSRQIEHRLIHKAQHEANIQPRSPFPIGMRFSILLHRVKHCLGCQPNGCLFAGTIAIASRAVHYIYIALNSYIYIYTTRWMIDAQTWCMGTHILVVLLSISCHKFLRCQPKPCISPDSTDINPH